jgi:hypothetical protein
MERVEKETRRVVGKREKEPPPGGGDCGHRGPRGFMRGGTSAERPAALLSLAICERRARRPIKNGFAVGPAILTGAMSKRLWTLWVSQRRRLIHKSIAEAVSTATRRVLKAVGSK